jgi:hypothetical protein
MWLTFTCQVFRSVGWIKGIVFSGVDVSVFELGSLILSHGKMESNEERSDSLFRIQKEVLSRDCLVPLMMRVSSGSGSEIGEFR